jgi:hypothetical protein
MRAASSVTTRARTWIGPAGLLIAGAVLLTLLLRPPGERGLIGDGAAYTIAAYDLVLALVGLGVATAQLSRWPALLVFVALGAGIPFGIAGEHRLAAQLTLTPDSARQLGFVGPLACVAAGLALAPGALLRAVLAPVAAACCGAALGFLVAFHDPSLGDPRFAGGGAAAGLWLLAAPAIVLRRFKRGWLRIGGRILASWLIAIGLLLGGSKYVVQQRAAQPVAVVPPPPPSYRPPPVNAPAIGDNPSPLRRPSQWDDQNAQP